jgi:hypothetical protein
MIENAKFSGFDVKEKFWKTESQSQTEKFQRNFHQSF